MSTTAEKGTSKRYYRRILRPFTGPSGTYKPGDVVDVTDWRHSNLQSLIRAGRVSDFLVAGPAA